MKITVRLMIPTLPKDMDLDTLFEMEEFCGITPEDEEFYQQTYEDYIISLESECMKHIYLAMN